jgi:alkylated DNA repair protein alkB family protein 7
LFGFGVQVHILDLHKNGYIKPHIDSTRYCGDTISGLSLLSDSVMRLRKKNERMELIVDLLLLRRSLYRLVGIARHDFKHEILAENESRFKEVQVPRERRVSVIIRELPNREFAESDFLLKGQLSPE